MLLKAEEVVTEYSNLGRGVGEYAYKYFLF